MEVMVAVQSGTHVFHCEFPRIYIKGPVSVAVVHVVRHQQVRPFVKAPFKSWVPREQLSIPY